MRISLLADKPECIPALAAGTLVQYASLWPDRDLAWRIARLRTHLNRRTLPIAWVIHDEHTVFGTAALRVHDVAGLEHLTPWLGGVYVFPEFRGRGLGRTLCTTVEEHAAQRQVEVLHLGTFDNRQWYASMGWRVMESIQLQGRRCDIMHKGLTPDAGT